MTVFPSQRLPALLALGISSAVALAPAPAVAQVAAPSAAQAEVLDLDEAAALLRVGPEVVRELAQTQRIPARRVGDTWRFSRSALLQWLQATAAVSSLRARGDAPEQPTRMAQAAGATNPASGTAAPPTIGERPTAPTAEEVALRDQRALLKRGALTVDLGVSYSYSEQSFLPFVRQERRVVGLNTSVRYGLVDDLQATLRLPASSSRIKTYTLGSGGGPATLNVTSDTGPGDVALSLRGVALREAVGRPNLIWSVDAVVPSGPGDRGVGVGLVASKSYDPAVIFAGLSYLRGLDLDAADPRRTLPKHNVGLSMGYTYAVNDALALSSVFAGSWRSVPTPADGTFPVTRERHQFQLGLTWSVARGLFMEPAVAMRLGGENPDLSLSLNVAYTF